MTLQTFINLPPLLSEATAAVVADTNPREVNTHAKNLHGRYMQPERREKSPLLRSNKDMLAYLSLRFPATYAQITSALLQVQERIPNWQPKTMLDLGCGPATGIHAAKSVWPTIARATAIDQESYFLTLGKELMHGSKLNLEVNWIQQSVSRWSETADDETYDLVIVSSVINELSGDTKNKLLDVLTRMKVGVVILLEPGTQHGFEIIQSCAERVAQDRKLIAPFIDNTFIKSESYWIHFSQRFTRPEFQRRVRQAMREGDEKASDWEDSKYCYVAFGSVTVEHMPYAVTIGSIERYHGYLIVPLLTAKGIEKVKVMKRHKDQYRFGKNLAWGETITNPSELYFDKPSI